MKSNLFLLTMGVALSACVSSPNNNWEITQLDSAIGVIELRNVVTIRSGTVTINENKAVNIADKWCKENGFLGAGMPATSRSRTFQGGMATSITNVRVRCEQHLGGNDRKSRNLQNSDKPIGESINSKR
ncbi:MAG: hypothetical protein AAF720_05520 [Pseudomonadota bacterium]